MELRDLVGRNLSYLRQELGQNRDSVAAQLGIDPVSLYRYEQGRNLMSIELLIDLCKFYKVSIDKMLTTDIKAKERNYW